MKIMAIDFETTGLQATDHAIEVASVIYDPEDRKIYDVFSTLINPGISHLRPEITDITGIRLDDLEKFGISKEEAFRILCEKAKHCSHFMAHNSDFDRGFFNRACNDIIYTNVVDNNLLKELVARPWIDTITCIPWKTFLGSRSLAKLALEHGSLTLGAHRAIFDCFTMIDLLERHDFTLIFNRFLEPDVIVHAVLSYEDNHKAKAAGFFWDSNLRSWVRKIKLQDCSRIDEFPFPVKVEVQK